MSKSEKGDITAMKRSKAVCEMALFQDRFHEGVEPGDGPELLVLFEPGFCLRDPN